MVRKVPFWQFKEILFGFVILANGLSIFNAIFKQHSFQKYIILQHHAND